MTLEIAGKTFETRLRPHLMDLLLRNVEPDIALPAFFENSLVRRNPADFARSMPLEPFTDGQYDRCHLTRNFVSAGHAVSLFRSGRSRRC